MSAPQPGIRLGDRRASYHRLPVMVPEATVGQVTSRDGYDDHDLGVNIKLIPVLDGDEFVISASPLPDTPRRASLSRAALLDELTRGRDRLILLAQQEASTLDHRKMALARTNLEQAILWLREAPVGCL